MNYIGKGPAVGPIITPPPATLGRLVQTLSHVRVDFLSLAGTFPLDDTIPQIGEGNEFFNVPFVPMFAGSRLRLRAQWSGSLTAAGTFIGGFFRTGTPDCLACGVYAPSNADYDFVFQLEHELIVGSLAAVVFTFRGGANAGNSRLNGRAARTMGGATTSFFRVDEFSPA